jgi:hypothetical protein
VDYEENLEEQFLLEYVKNLLLLDRMVDVLEQLSQVNLK